MNIKMNMKTNTINTMKTIATTMILAAVLTISITSCSRKDAAVSGDAVPVTVHAVNTIVAAQGSIRDYLAVSGDIVNTSTVDTFSDVAGKVSRVFVGVGSRVRRNDPVVEIDPSRPGMEFVPSLVRAPVSGTVVALPAQLGMTINQAVPLARIADSEDLEIQLRIAERFISQIALRQRAEIILMAWPGEVFQGRITELSPTLDPASRSMGIRVGVQDPSRKLKSGMFATVRIIVEEKDNVVKIPASAVINRFGEQFVFAVDMQNPAEPVVRRKIIVPGIAIDGIVEITQGLAPNEEVVIRGQSLLEDGSRVNIIDRLPPVGSN